MSKIPYKFLLILFLCFLLCFSNNILDTTATKTEFDFGTLTLSSLKLLGDAHFNNGSLRLSRDLAVPNSGSGRVLYSKPVRFRQPGTNFPVSFSTFFSFSIANLNPSSIGGGLAFIISPEDDTVGEAGGFLGLIEEESVGSGFVAVEFDTLMDVEFKDINGNHVGLDLNTMVSSQVGDLGALEIDLKSGDLINAWINYDGLTRVFNISVSYSDLKPKEPLLSFELNLDQYVNDFMYVGFSGSTQGSTEIHSIEWWSFTSSFDSSSDSGSLPVTSTPPPPLAILTNPAANSVKSPPPSSPAPSDSDNLVSNSSQKNIKSSSCHNQLCKQGAGAVVGVVTAGAFVLALFAGVIWVYSKKPKYVKKPISLASEIIKMPKEFSYRELKSATKCFNPNRIIGDGAFGTVYKGILPETGEIVAVKRCSHNTQGNTEFLSELSIIGTLRHRNLVRLQGWCHEKGEILLVYDIMRNGSLDKALYESQMPLPWPHRLKILVGVASALAYLHQECEYQVIHRDVKTSNIMLDEEFNARLGDFGLAKQIEHNKSSESTVAAGTMGYLAPEYLLTGRASDKTDVFSYGAVVLEVASGRRPIETENINLVEWVWSLHREGRLIMAADEGLVGEFQEEEMRKVLAVGLTCCHPDPAARPAMRSVVQMLVGEAEVAIVDRENPSVSFSMSDLLLRLQDSESDCNGMTTISTSSSDDLFNGGYLV